MGDGKGRRERVPGGLSWANGLLLSGRHQGPLLSRAALERARHSRVIVAAFMGFQIAAIDLLTDHIVIADHPAKNPALGGVRLRFTGHRGKIMSHFMRIEEPI